MSEFRIDVLDASGNIVGDGPIVNVLALSNTRCLDRIGEATFSIPASDPRSALIGAGRQFDIYDRVDGYLGRFAYKSRTIKERGGVARLEVRCHDQLRELTYHTVGFRRSYNNQAVNVVVSDLASAAGWTANVESNIGNTTVTYEGESVLAAIDVLRDRWGRHYRLGQPGVLEFGAFGDDSGVRLTNLRGQVQTDIADRTEIAIVDSITLVEEADEVVNRVIALGAGQGVSQLTMAQATVGSYPVQTGVNADGSLYYYIEDAVSVAAYGRRTRVLTFPNIRPITNSETNIINASNTLKLCAEAYLRRHLVPKVTYDVSVIGLRSPTPIIPGDTVRLAYRGVVEGYTYIDVNELFYVMDVQCNRQAGGQRTTSVTISTTADRRTADTDIIADVINDVRALKVHVPITLAYSPVGPYTQRLDSSRSATFTVRIGNEVTALNYAILRFKTSPLRSSVSTVGASESTVATSSAGGGGTVTSAAGGGTTLTSESGGGTTVTSAAGGGQTSGGGSSHSHKINVKRDSNTLNVANLRVDLNTVPAHLCIYASGGDIEVGTTQSESSHTHAVYSHTHNVTINNHTHDVNIPSHTHGVTINNHTHDVTVPGHNHALTYGLYEDTTYPQNITITVDGVTVPGGPWAPTNAGVEHEIDITSLLTSGTLRMNHSIVFSCGVGRGEIEFECDMLCSIQAIAVS